MSFKSKSGFIRKMMSLSLTAAVALSGLIPLQPVLAEGPANPAPFLEPAGAANGKKVLFDNTHGQTAGAADWVIDGAFSDFANELAASGYYVKELRKAGPIELADLQDYDVLVIPEASIPFQASEQEALLQYTAKGGSIFFIADHYNADRNKNRWDASEIFNGYRRGAWTDPAKGMSDEERKSAAMKNVASSDWLAANFGVRFRYNATGDATATDFAAPEQAFGITSGVASVAVHGGSTLAITDPQKAKGIVYLPANSEKWPYAADQGVYAEGGRNEGAFVAVSKAGAGKAGFIGDSSLFEDNTPKYFSEETGAVKTTFNGFHELNNSTLLINMINWLSTPESYVSLHEVNGLALDEPTPLLASEAPEASTETQGEPWAASAEEYKWWDPTTFKSGSYGYTPTVGNGVTSTLIISEYIEGSGDNKAIEIYNGTGGPIDLSGHTLYQSHTSKLIGLTGTVNSGEVYIIANPNASASIRSKANVVSPLLTFDGNDRIELRLDELVIDAVGYENFRFGEDVTLVRKSVVKGGTSVFKPERWDSYPVDTTTYLGSHIIGPGNRAPVLADPISDLSAAAGNSLTVDASSAFRDPDGDLLTLSAVSKTAAVASVSVSGSKLSINAVSAGTAVISVTASDSSGQSVTRSFFVTVK